MTQSNGDGKNVASANEFYFIAQKTGTQHEDLRDEERTIIARLGITLVDFNNPEGIGIYKIRDEAIAVARLLKEAKPQSRHLAVIAGMIDPVAAKGTPQGPILK